ncbi:hypothetical protein L9F63_020808, partial [Diploptera punctata]
GGECAAFSYLQHNARSTKYVITSKRFLFTPRTNIPKSFKIFSLSSSRYFVKFDGETISPMPKRTESRKNNTVDSTVLTTSPYKKDLEKTKTKQGSNIGGLTLRNNAHRRFRRQFEGKLVMRIPRRYNALIRPKLHLNKRSRSSALDIQKTFFSQNCSQGVFLTDSSFEISVIVELNLNTNVMADFQSVHGTLASSKLNSRINTLCSCFEMSFLSSTLMSCTIKVNATTMHSFEVLVRCTPMALRNTTSSDDNKIQVAVHRKMEVPLSSQRLITTLFIEPVIDKPFDVKTLQGSIDSLITTYGYLFDGFISCLVMYRSTTATGRVLWVAYRIYLDRQDMSALSTSGLYSN